ncbi:MAG: sigma-70 family RNA polymerase sigma factor [Acidobacteria bacterium]|nr:MAG: sigma-70 family RNA polymerase sigma factor [Acidobacteriota bacterium]REK02823.1 MAG: sigma-70 family RNA polymerase sigma factor [Acidobacteriota bacterium]REK13373.1 MAG: sigma-70 family RNA polymerase sigma factor [Acidobacteriota bacterium]REK41367.1 MAG: sigma-70 family RNA polymerase sigma factor [Acidobacteriota bacterium]
MFIERRLLLTEFNDKIFASTMTSVPEKFHSTIEEATARLISRAENARGLSKDDILERITGSVWKYLLKHDESAGHPEIKEFIDTLHADDLCLIIACERGDENAWGDLVLNFDLTVKSAAWNFCKNREDADDLAGSIWAELHGLRLDSEGRTKGKLSYYSGKGSLSGWLRAVTNQLAIDEYRKMKKIVQVEEDRVFENMAKDSSERTDFRAVVSTADTPEEILGESEAQEDILEALLQAVEDLGSEERLLMKMYYYDGLILKEIADTFGYHEATASRKITRIQTKIRKVVENILSDKHGWGEAEVKRHLSDSAEKLGINIEQMFVLLIAAAFVQEIAAGSVHWLHF